MKKERHREAKHNALSPTAGIGGAGLPPRDRISGRVLIAAPDISSKSHSERSLFMKSKAGDTGRAPDSRPGTQCAQGEHG